MLDTQYKYKIDKGVLTDFLLADTVTEAHIKELRKVIVVVVIKHYGQYLRDKDMMKDIEQQAVLEVLCRRKNYDPSYPAYNYIYTICRDQIGNYIVKLSKETIVEDILPIYNASVSPDYLAELPHEIERFTKYLTGEKKFDVINLSQQDAVNLSMFFLLHTKTRNIRVPSFIPITEEAITQLYKLAVQI